jgi:branched-chain amino acid transport system permease protein
MDGFADAAIMVLVFATLATAWSWLGASAGVVSFAHAVFFGLGGYAVAVSNMRGGSPWYGALGGALASVIVALICGLLCLRGRGYTFAAVTLVLGAIAEPLVAARSWLGPHDAFAFPLRLGFLNLQFAQKGPYVLLALVVFVVALAVTFGLGRARIGYQLRALRASPRAARAIGIDALPPRLLVLAASAFFTAVVGSFFAEYVHGVTPSGMFALSLGFDIALIGGIAGSASAWGAPLAGLVYALLARVLPLHPPGAAGIAVLVVEGLAIVFIAFGQVPGRERFTLPRTASTGAGSVA